MLNFDFLIKIRFSGNVTFIGYIMKKIILCRLNYDLILIVQAKQTYSRCDLIIEYKDI